MVKLQRIKKIDRKCAVCGKRIKIKIYENGYYRNGHYFGEFKLPIKGMGDYKKVGTSRLLGKKIDIVKWVGKGKKREYWECNKCFEEVIHEEWLEKIIEKLYSKRCPDYERGCPCCEAWEVFDTIIDANRGRL